MPFSVTLENHQRLKNFEEHYSKEESNPNYFKKFSEYISKGGGTYRFFKLLSQSCKWGTRLVEKLWSPNNVNIIFKTGKKFHLVSKNLILTKIPFDLVELDKTYKDYKSVNDKDIIRKRDSLAKKVAETIADFSFLFQLGELLSLYTLGTILSPSVQFSGSLFLLFQYTMGLKIESEDFIDHSKMRKEVENQKYPVQRVKKILHEIKNLDLLRFAKSISSIAVALLFLYELTFQIALVSSTTFLFIATASTVLAIWEHFYRESMTYQLIKK